MIFNGEQFIGRDNILAKYLSMGKVKHKIETIDAKDIGNKNINIAVEGSLKFSNGDQKVFK